MISVLNFRELGGYLNKEGQSVKQHVFYRGAPFREDRLSLEDKKELDAINFKYIIDFRSEKEIKRHGTLYIPEGAKYLNLPAITKEMDNQAYGDMDMEHRATEAGVTEWIENIYLLLPFNSEAYRGVFDILKRHETPIYFHCSAGKDRTGLCAALILLALGVDEKTVFEDYLISVDKMTEDMKRRNLVPQKPNLVFKEWLESALKAILEKYPSYEAYFEKELNLSKEDLEDLKAYYLQ